MTEPMGWDPEQYLAFETDRARPFRDLLARVGASAPRRVVDLGCGPGQLTGLLAEHWPSAEIDALDAAPEMVAEARARGVPARQADVRTWTPTAIDDVVVCNAVLHWVPEHPQLLARWIPRLPKGGWFAFQVPGNHQAPSHALVRELLAERRWRDRVAVPNQPTVCDLSYYAELLVRSGAEVDAWETTYLHRLVGADPVLAWISGSLLRSVRNALDDEEWRRFRDELAPRLRAAYPRRSDGTTWYPFRRLFVVARTHETNGRNRQPGEGSPREAHAEVR